MMRLLRSVRCALCGLMCTVKQERNFRIHLVATVAVAVFSALYGVTRGQAVLLTLTCALVLCAELINTAVERTVDLLSPERSELARIAKDASAAAVFVCSVASVVVAVILFRDPIGWNAVFQAVKTPVFLILAPIFVALSILFVWGVKNHKS